MNRTLAEPLELRTFRPMITAKDFTRTHNVIPATDLYEASGYLAVDIYDGFSPDMWFKYLAPLSANMTASDLNMGLFCAWVGRCFYGDAGQCEEALWYRKTTNGQHRIHFSQDSVSFDPYIHETLDWMWDGTKFPTRTVECLDGPISVTLFWTEWARVGSMRVMGFGFTTGKIADPVACAFVRNLVEIETPVVVKSEMPIFGTYITEFRSSMYSKFRNWSGPMKDYVAPLTEKVLVYKPLVQEIINQYAVERLRNYNIGRVHKTLLAVLNNVHFRDLSRRIPILTSDFHRMTLAIMHDGLEDKVRVAESYNSTLAAAAEKYNQLHGEAFATAPAEVPNTNSWPSTLGMVGGAATCALVLYRVYNAWRAPTPKTTLFTPGSVVDLQQTVYTCLMVPVIEEIYKKWLSTIPLGYGCSMDIVFGPLEFLHNLYRFRHVPIVQRLQMCLPALAMHEVCRKLPIMTAISLHSLFNTAATLQQEMIAIVEQFRKSQKPSSVQVEEITPGMFTAWRELFYFTPWEERLVIPTIRSLAEKYSPELSLIPRSLEPYSTFPPVCPSLHITGELPFKRERNPTHFHLLLPCQIPGYVPAVTDYNLACAVRYRILAAPPLDPEIQRRNWNWAARFMVTVDQYPAIEWEKEVGTWLAHFDNAKRSKYTVLIMGLNQQTWTYYAEHARKTSLFMKSNEILFKTDELGQMQLKPRVIINVHPKVQCLVGPVIWRVQQNMKMEWPMIPKICSQPELDYSISYAGAATDEDLSVWMDHALQMRHGFCLIVSGDDALAVGEMNGTHYVIEGDASMYDQSQSIGPLSMGWRVCKKLGADDETIDLLSTLSYNTYTVEPRQREDASFFKINKRDRPLRDTGGADTSVGNSIVIALAWIFVLRVCCISGFALENMEKLFMFLGIKMKLKLPTLNTCTFLRGMWYHTTRGYYWGPLPSRFLKMGKSLKDPRAIYKLKDYTLACRYYLNDIAQSYKTFVSVPLIRTFVENFCFHKKQFHLLDRYQIQAADTTKPQLVEEAYIALEEKYGITKKDWARVEKLIPREPFVFLTDPVFDSLVATDHS